MSNIELIDPTDAESTQRDAATPRCRTRVIVNRPEEMEMKAHPINPDWIIDGSPVARSAQHSESFDGWAGTAIWDCTAGTFHWHFGGEESLMILEGEVRVTDDSGRISILTEGSIAYFPAGSHFVWHVPTYVRKVVYFRREVPLAVRRVYAARSFVGRGVQFALRVVSIWFGVRYRRPPRSRKIAVNKFSKSR